VYYIIEILQQNVPKISLILASVYKFIIPKPRQGLK
jgi:hypothetical protein